MSSSSDDSVGLDPSVLEAASDLIGEKLDEDDVGQGRRRFFEGVRALQEEQTEEAVQKFRRAARDAGAPFDDLARVARGECERLRGKTGVALREWREVAEAEHVEPPIRYMAWLSIAAAAESRSADRLLERAHRAIAELETSDEV